MLSSLLLLLMLMLMLTVVLVLVLVLMPQLLLFVLAKLRLVCKMMLDIVPMLSWAASAMPRGDIDGEDYGVLALLHEHSAICGDGEQCKHESGPGGPRLIKPRHRR
mmetsp:Transcript_13430/g.36088  ORF Transcript_13430/g.36088 Transcript_13430/m.36088 type:complete len:106 (+) Transcript_13430:97-414(+)